MFLKAPTHAKAKSANEQQNTPSKKSCSSKIEIVIFRPNQRTSDFSPFDSSRSQNVTQLVSAEALAFQTDRLCREVRSGFGSYIAT
jgi:hypothetical protein